MSWTLQDKIAEAELLDPQVEDCPGVFYQCYRKVALIDIRDVKRSWMPTKVCSGCAEECEIFLNAFNKNNEV